MKISPMLSPGTTVGAVEGQAPRQELTRALKMTTNATPGAPGPQELSNLDDNSKENPNATVEATQPLSPQLAALAKQKRALQVKERELLDLKKELEAKSQGGDFIPKSRLKSETLKVLEEAGVTYEDLTQAILDNQGNPEFRALEAKLKALEEGVDKRLTEATTQEEARLYREVDRDAKSIIASRADDFELIQKMDRVPLAVEIWKREYKESGEFPDIEGILKDVEDHCLQECQEFTKLKKIQGLFQQPAEPSQQPQQRSQVMRTLTNKDTASVPMDRRARALSAFYGARK